MDGACSILPESFASYGSFFYELRSDAKTESYSGSIAVYKVASGAKKRNINWEVIEFKDSSQQQQSIANTKQ